jgi:hypothetical protein
MVGMAEVPPDWRTPVPQNAAMPNHRSGDGPLAFLLLLLQAPLMYIARFVVGLRAMGVGACAYEGCGHRAWLDWVMGVQGLGGVAVLVGTAVWTRVRSVRHQPVLSVPAIGYVAQIGLAVVCWAIIAAGSH